MLVLDPRFDLDLVGVLELYTEWAVPSESALGVRLKSMSSSKIDDEM